jgi:Bul1 C terminus
VRVKILSTADGKPSIAAEATEPVQIMPVYSWWQSRTPQRPQSSPTYERLESPLDDSAPGSGPARIVEAQKMLKKGFLGKKKGTVSASIEVPDCYHINVGKSDNTTARPLPMPIKMRYSPITADLPPNVSSLSARLHAHTRYNVDSHRSERNANIFATSVTILSASTPSTSTPLWLEDSTAGQLSFVSNLLIPMNLPPAAGSSSEKNQKVLLPSFESCFISRSYQIEVRIGFDGGSEVLLRVPTSIVAKPATSEAELAIENAIRVADDWTPPGQDTVAGEVEPELLRPTAFNLNINDRETSPDSSDTENAPTESPTTESVQLVPNSNIPLDAPPDYSLVVALVNPKEDVVQHQVTAVAA